MSPTEVAIKVAKNTVQLELNADEQISVEIYNVFKKTLSFRKEDRPTFPEICKELDVISENL